MTSKKTIAYVLGKAAAAVESVFSFAVVVTLLAVLVKLGVLAWTWVLS